MFAVRGAWTKRGDPVIAVGVAVVVLVTTLAEDRPESALDVFAYALVAASGVSLVFGRRAPLTILVLTGLCAVGYQATGLDVPAVAFLFAVYAAVRAGHRLIALTVSLAMVAALPLAALFSGVGDVGEAFAQGRESLQVAWLIAAAAAGEALRQSERRAAEAERATDQVAQRRADEERLRIARELHDSLTHQISIIKIQADVAIALARKRGEKVPEAVLAIRSAGREANRELRATLGALRNDGTAPPSGIDQIPELLETAEGFGMDTTLTISGRRYDVPDAVGRTAFRIIQEALTNAARHGAAVSASVAIDYRPSVLAVNIDDDGKAVPGTDPIPGIGLLGMHERVTALGGRLLAGPRDAGGFRVHAELPTGQAS